MRTISRPVVPIGTPDATIDEKLAATRWIIGLLSTVRFSKKNLNMTIMSLNHFENVLAKVASGSGDPLTPEQLEELQNIRQDIRRKLDELANRSMRP
jgi:hypothetical protein